MAAWYNRGIDLHPNDAQAHNNRGITKARLGDMEGARADWQRALELEPGMREAEENLRKLGGAPRTCDCI